eukprot:1642566-Rhodomonas_salina.1
MPPKPLIPSSSKPSTTPRTVTASLLALHAQPHAARQLPPVQLAQQLTLTQLLAFIVAVALASATGRALRPAAAGRCVRFTGPDSPLAASHAANSPSVASASPPSESRAERFDQSAAPPAALASVHSRAQRRVDMSQTNMLAAPSPTLMSQYTSRTPCA